MTDTVTRRRGLRVWLADLAMGFRFAVAGGRSGWTRAGLTSLGIALGVAMLLVAASIPNIMASQSGRFASLESTVADVDAKVEDGNLRLTQDVVQFRDVDIWRVTIHDAGDDPQIPPGIDALPDEGEMYVSPALKELLESGDAEMLKPRIDYEIAGIIAEDGLVGPRDLRMYATDSSTRSENSYLSDGFGTNMTDAPNPMPPILVLLILVAITILLLPVVMFVAVAVRFGGERRDRRLAALRLVGADSAAVRRMAAGESLLGAVAGLLLGVALFEGGVRALAATGILEYITGGELTVFAHDVDPDPVLGAIVVLAIPLVAIFATQLSMRRLVIEPLGVVREAKPRRRRLWWRLVLIVIGAAGLAPQAMDRDVDTDGIGGIVIVTGVLAMLLGMAALLPWLVERLVARLRGGSVSWQLATRRLQLGGGSAARAIVGIAVAVAGAVALQMLFTTVAEDQVEITGLDSDHGEITGYGSQSEAAELVKGTERLDGVTVDTWYSTLTVMSKNEESQASMVIADCDHVREIAEVGGCADGDAFAVEGADFDLRSGDEVSLWDMTSDSEGGEVDWTVPRLRDTVPMKDQGDNSYFESLIVTPGAVDESLLKTTQILVNFELDRSKPDAIEQVRNLADEIGPDWSAYTYDTERMSSTFDRLRTALLVGVVATMLLIGVSLLVNTLEQLQERRRLTSVLVAFGTRRRSLVFSVLWQTAVPVVCGLVIATATGMVMGTMLVGMTGDEARMDWPNIAAINGAGVTMVLIVTLLSLPLLWRMMRPDGMRTE